MIFKDDWLDRFSITDGIVLGVLCGIGIDAIILGVFWASGLLSRIHF